MDRDIPDDGGATRAEVSVAMCTRNGERWVGEQLRSILAQTRPPDEVVVSDDASSDTTLERVAEVWAEADQTRAPKLRVIRNAAPLGVAKNFEQATLACRGGLIALSDQDDVWARGRLERMTAEFDERSTLDLLFTDARLIDATGADLGLSLFEALEVRSGDLAAIRHGRAFETLIRRNLATGATVMFRRRLLASSVPFAAGWVHDEWLAIIAAAVSQIDWMPDHLIGYRQHSGNQIGVAAPTLRYKIARVFEASGDRPQVLADRAIELRERLASIGASGPVLALADGKVAHQRARATLPPSRMRRIAPVVREALTGRYRRFSSRGRLDIARDILQRDAASSLPSEQR
jgi:glycosyltransferase involved in cell wall biosynthesis